ncbi:MAG: cobalamin-binding protein [Candidatus Kerfeldbacteria bacterium]|nr:cobalamin-binding protein [Candidatus Kerfeldbacteria bacterium]
MRLISLAPSNTEILYALGVGDQLVATTHFCDWPAAATNLPKIGGWINTEPEQIADFKPDIILTSYFVPEPLRSWSGPGTLLHVEPKSLSEVMDSIVQIGQAVGANKQAQNVVETMQAAFTELRAQPPAIRPTVYMEEWPQPPMVSGNWVPELVEIAGGQPVLAKSGTPSRGFELPELKDADPDFMIFHWCGFGERFDQQTLKKRGGWNDLRAVRNGNIHALDDSLLNRPGPRLVEGAQRIHAIVKTFTTV